jgi:DNA-binding response OmpR family regulator
MNEGREQLRVAVLDDDSGLIQVLSNRFEALGWQYRLISTPVPPQELVAMKLNAIVVDPRLLGEASWTYLERICGLLPELGIVVCTAGASVAEKVRGLRIGADDWVAKPCHPEEVVARIEAISRRRRRQQVSTDLGPLVVGEIEIRPDQFQGFVAGVSLDLTRREFELLQLLAQYQGRVLEREDIYQRVWGYAMAHGDRSVDVFVRKLRQKLQKRSPGWDYVHTHFGVGYRFDPQPLVPSEPSAATQATPGVRSQPFHSLDTAP